MKKNRTDLVNLKRLLNLTQNIFLVLLLTTTLQAQVEVNAQLQNNQIMIGDQVQLRVAISHSPNAEILEPNLGVLDSVPEVEVINKSPLRKTGGTDPILLEQNFLLTSFDSGYYFIPPIPVEYIINNKTRTAYTKQLALSVNPFPIQGDSLQIADIKPIIKEPGTWQDMLPYLLAFAGILLTIAGLFYFFGRKKKKTGLPPLPPAIQLPPHEIALQKLSALEKQQLWQKGELKKYYTDLTFIIREYLEGQFDLTALEATSDEIVDQVKPLDIDLTWKASLKDLFKTADLVKFAKAVPESSTHSSLFNEAKQFVIQTKRDIEIIEENEETEE